MRQYYCKIGSNVIHMNQKIDGARVTINVEWVAPGQSHKDVIGYVEQHQIRQTSCIKPKSFLDYSKRGFGMKLILWTLGLQPNWQENTHVRLSNMIQLLYIVEQLKKDTCNPGSWLIADGTPRLHMHMHNMYTYVGQTGSRWIFEMTDHTSAPQYCCDMRELTTFPDPV